MSKKADFKSRFSVVYDGDRNNYEYVPDMKEKAKELLKQGVKITASSKPSKTLLEELLDTIPLPEEKDEPKTVIRYGLKIAGGRRMFTSNDLAVAYWKRYNRGTPLNIKEVEVKA